MVGIMQKRCILFGTGTSDRKGRMGTPQAWARSPARRDAKVHILRTNCEPTRYYKLGVVWDILPLGSNNLNGRRRSSMAWGGPSLETTVF